MDFLHSFRENELNAWIIYKAFWAFRKINYKPEGRLNDT